MKDIFSSYHKHKVLSHVSLLTLSGFLAVGIHFALLNSPQVQLLKANILENEIPVESSVDFASFIRENQLVFQTSGNMQDVKEFTFSLAYDPEWVILGVSNSILPVENISELKNEDGFITYMLTFAEPLDIAENTEILSINFEKLQEKICIINPVQVNFKDSKDEVYLLSTQQLTF